MKLSEAIEVLKKLHNWLDYGAGELEPTANTVMKAIDTVLSLINTENKTGLDDRLQEKSIEVSDSQGNLSNKKDRLYTAEDMESFAEFLIGRNTEWITELERNETAKTLIELWEKERRAK